MRIREDLELINSWVKKNSKVLDLGCGDGSLLKMLKEQKNVTGYGIDYDISQIEIVHDNKFQKEPFGTAVNLSGENSLSEERVQDLINFIKKRSEKSNII